MIGKIRYRLGRPATIAIAITTIVSASVWALRLPRSEELFKAIQSGSYQRVQSLLDAGTNPNIFDAAGMTPLNTACRMGRVDLILALLRKGADPHQLSGDLTAYAWAAVSGKKEAIAALASYAPKLSADSVQEPALCYAEQPEVAKALLDRGATSGGFSKRFGFTPLQNAVLKGRYDVATVLMENDPTLNTESLSRDPILHLLFRSLPPEPKPEEWEKIDAFLISAFKKGLNFQYTDKSGSYAFEYLKNQSQRDHLEALLGAEAFEVQPQRTRPQATFKTPGKSQQQP